MIPHVIAGTYPTAAQFNEIEEALGLSPLSRPGVRFSVAWNRVAAVAGLPPIDEAAGPEALTAAEYNQAVDFANAHPVA